MEIKKKINAKVIVGKCKNGEMFGIRIEEKYDDWYRTWAFKMNPKMLKHEKYEDTVIKGNLFAEEGYMGCPYCGTDDLFICSNCNKVNCWNGEEIVKCCWCNHRGRIMEATEKLEFESDEF